MSGGEEKPGELQFIEIDDQFRRSRRNTLIACTISILLSASVAFDPSDWAPGPVIPLVTATSIPRPFASCAAFLAVLYFFVGFREDARAQRAKISEAVVNKSLEDLVEKAGKIESNLNAWLTVREAALQWYEEYLPKFEKFNSEIVQKAQESFESARSQLSEIGSHNAKLMQLEQRTPDGKSIHFPDAGAILQITDRIFMLSQNQTAVGAGFDDFYKRNLPNMVDWQKKPKVVKSFKLDGNLGEAVSSLEALNTSLSTIDKSFGERGREFFEFYQVRFVNYYLVAVFLAFEVSLAFQIFTHYPEELLG